MEKRRLCKIPNVHFTQIEPEHKESSKYPVFNKQQ